MKSRKTGTILLCVCGVLSLVDIVFLILAGVSGNNFELEMHKTTFIILFFVLAVIICLLYFLSRNFINKIDGDVLATRQKYESLKTEEITDFKSELNTVREKYAADENINKNQFPEMGNGIGAFKKFYDKQVLTKGKIYYGCLVEANSLLFKDNYKNLILPAVFLYSTDGYYEENPEELIAIAKRLFEDKSGNMLKNDFKWISNEKITCDGRELYVTTIPTHRLALPSGRITDKILPVIAEPVNCTSTFVVDPKYWSDKLVSNYCHGKIYETYMEKLAEKYEE